MYKQVYSSEGVVQFLALLTKLNSSFLSLLLNDSYAGSKNKWLVLLPKVSEVREYKSHKYLYQQLN